MDKPQLNMAAEAFQQKFPGRNNLVHVTGAFVLVVLPSCAEVSLYNPVCTVFANGGTQSTAHARVYHPAVYDVDAGFFGMVGKGAGKFRVVVR